MEIFVWIKVLEILPQLPEYPVDEEEVQTGGIQQRKETALTERKIGAGVSTSPSGTCPDDLTSPC